MCTDGSFFEFPLAYFFTWPTYGTWLPGDTRGWIEYRNGWQLPDPIRELEAMARMTEQACILDRKQRQTVEQTVTEVCVHRNWQLYEVNCRTNHVHVVVHAMRHPKQVRIQFKAWATRRLKELDSSLHGSVIRQNWWAERGSCRFINSEVSLQAAVDYVRDGQERR